MTDEKTYNGVNIKVLRGLQAVRVRPGMYIGDTSDGSALHHCLWEVVDNSVDEHLGGHCDHISITLTMDGGVLVEDNGRGIPVDIHPEEGIPSMIVVMTVLHAGGKFDGDGYAISSGLHGVGVSAVNAVSDCMIVDVYRNNKKYTQAFAQGDVCDKFLEEDSDRTETGTSVYFHPDPAIFTGVLNYDFERVKARVQELAYLNAGLTITLADERSGTQADFCYEGGLRQYLEDATQKREPVHPDVVHFATPEVEVALRWTNQGITDIRCFTNNVYNQDGGTHLTGLKAALSRYITARVHELGMDKTLREGIQPEDVREGLVAMLSLRIPDPAFSSQTKDKLVTAGARGLVEMAFEDYFEDYLRNGKDVNKILNRIVLAAKAREAAKRARDNVKRQGLLDMMSLPGKLADCQSRVAADTEILIVEGDSAGGSTKQGRDRRFQAVLPLRGKVLNAERADIQSIVDNKELGALITALGCGLESTGSYDPARLRYHRIIIMTDADVDGSHIRTLLLTFFYRHMPRLIWDGHIFAAVPPLYRVRLGKKDFYCNTDEERDAILAGAPERKAQITRYKGLGEMNPETLWETTLDPDYRILRPLTIEDAAQAETLFHILMGEDVEIRRAFIEDNADAVRNLDI